MRGNALLAVFALLAVSVRALVPGGMMLGPDEQSGRYLVVKLCTAQGNIDAKVDLATGKTVSDDGGHDEAPAHKGDHPPCAFAAAPAFATPVTAVAVAKIPVSEVQVELTATAPTTPGQGLAAPPPWSTGPPQTV